MYVHITVYSNAIMLSGYFIHISSKDDRSKSRLADDKAQVSAVPLVMSFSQ